MDKTEHGSTALKLRFSVSAHIARPLHETFEAIADPDLLSRYFTTGGARGRLEAGATVMWEFHDYPGAFPVRVLYAEPDRRIVLQWGASEDPSSPGSSTAASGTETTVTFTFTALEDGRTRVDIAEEEWRQTQGGLDGSYGNCAGWMQMLCALKAYLEHGINLRQGMFI